jgi:response regulator RpfG family c-di-GMP phosphodiesterase
MRKNILSINGNRPMNYLLQTVLCNRYNFISASDVYQGIHQLKGEEEIDLIIIDADYHTQESWDFIQHLKTSGLYHHKPVIVLASRDKKANERSNRSKVYDLFYKPFSPLDIVKSIDALMLAKPLEN